MRPLLNLFCAVIVAGGLAVAVHSEPESPTASPTPQATPETITTPSGWQYQVLSPGLGPTKAESGHMVSVHYVGTLSNGNKFDSSYDRNVPIEFRLGKRQVIPGWEEGISGMRVGEKRRLIIPFNLAYGENGRPPVIPPRATLIFDTELVKIAP